MPDPVQDRTDIREVVRDRYAKAAREAAARPTRPAVVAGQTRAARVAART